MEISMENSLKGLILAAGTIITCLVITLGFYLSKEAQSTASTGTSKIGRINTEFAESDKTIYDGVKVSGSEVVNAIKKMSEEEIGVYVETNSASTYYGYVFNSESGELKGKSENVYNANIDNTSSEYINPYAMFMGKIIRNSNNVIIGIEFRQV
jgi:DNA integrity scanning protein DisA with diadenylate cyclase activity